MKGNAHLFQLGVDGLEPNNDKFVNISANEKRRITYFEEIVNTSPSGEINDKV